MRYVPDFEPIPFEESARMYEEILNGAQVWEDEDGRGFVLVCPEFNTRQKAADGYLKAFREWVGEQEKTLTIDPDLVDLRWASWVSDESFYFVGSDDPRRQMQIWQVDEDAIDGYW